MARSLTTRSTNPKIMDGNIKILDDNLGKASAPDAEDVVYDNTDSGLTADDVQAAIDEIVGFKSVNFTANENIDGTKIEAVEHNGLVILSFYNADVSSNLAVTSELVSLNVNAKYQSSGVIYSYASGTNIFKTIPIYVNKNTGVVRCIDSITTGTTLGGCLIFAKA